MKQASIAIASLFLSIAQAYSGDMTYFTPGLGSCGYTNSDSDAIVALSTSFMNNPPNPNNNPYCGTTINIVNPSTGSTHTATIVDTCTGCGYYDIDVSPSVFEAVDGNGLSAGRIPVTWGGSKVGGKVKRDLRV